MTGSSLSAMAWRNLWRNRRRTAITLSSIALGTLLAVLFTGIGDANWRRMIDLAARMGGGHVTLQHPDYADAPSLGRTLPDADALRDLALRDPEVERAVARIAGSAMISSAGRSYGAAFLGFDPDVEDATTLSILEAVTEGEVFGADERGILLGARLAENLRVGVGRKVVYTVTDKRGEIVQEAVRVRGIVRTGAPSIDTALCLLPLRGLREALGYAEGETLQLALFLRDQRSADAVAERLAAAIGPAVAILPWHQVQPDVASFIAMKVASARFMEGVILVLVAAGIFNTLFVGVMERMREFGVLLAIGFGPSRLFGLVMLESLWLALVGLGLAVVVTAGPYAYLARVGVDISAQLGEGGTEVAGVAVSPIITAGIYPENALLIALAVCVATLLSGIYPAWRAGSVAPVESIRLV